jgi:dienelactone hydrolase
MKTRYVILFLLVLGELLIFPHNGQSQSKSASVREQMKTYTSDGKTFNAYVVFDQNLKGKRPVILVVPEWWGQTDYPKMRARMLAELGYFAMAVDLYGDGKVASNPTEAKEMTAPYYQDPSLAKKRLDAAIQKLSEFPDADPSEVAAIGYCFGGFVVLNSAKLGAGFKGVVSFHGGLGGVQADKKLLKAKILAFQGEEDKFVTAKDISAFKHQMDSIGADYSFKVYPGATHAFSNPDATALGKKFNIPIAYNEAADKDSWNQMKMFLDKIFQRK